MARRTKILFALGILLLLGCIAGWWWENELSSVGDSILSAYSKRYVRTVTTDLPRYDRVEVFHLDGNVPANGDQHLQPNEAFHTDVYGGGEDRILGHVTLEGSDAEAFAALWRSQKFDWGLQKLCHSPLCGLRFYSGRKLMFQTTVCFHCSNFYVTVPLLGTGWWGFDTNTSASENLVRRVWVLFPDAKPIDWAR